MNLQISSQSLALNLNCQIFACKHFSELLCFGSTQGYGRIYPTDAINWLTPIFSAPAPGQFASEITQKQSWVWLMQEHKLCVTHLVTQCCPPALLTQVCTSATGLGLKAAGETALPCSNNEWGLGVCVGGPGIWTSGPPNYSHPLTFRSTLHGCICAFVWLSVIWAPLLIFLSFSHQS